MVRYCFKRTPTGNPPVNPLTVGVICQPNQLNPCVMRIEISAASTDQCTTIVSDSIEVDFGGGNVVSFTDVRACYYDLSAFQGQTGTVTYTASQGFNTDSATCSVTVPTFNRELTVDETQPASATNFQTLTDGVNALVDGDRLTVMERPGGAAYMMRTTEEPGRWSISNHSNICIVGSGNVILDGDAVASNLIPQNGMWLTSNLTNSLISNFTMRNANHNVFSFDAGANGVVLQDITIEDSYFLGVQTVGGNDFVFNRVIVNRMNRALDGGAEMTTGAADAFNLRGGTALLKLVDCEANDGDRHGFVVRDVVDCRCYGGISFNNGAQGFVTNQTQNLYVESMVMRENGTAGIQIEEDSIGYVFRFCDIDGNNTYDNNSFGPPVVNQGGEAGVWVNDSAVGMFEFCTIRRNAVAVRVNGDTLLATQVSDDNIFRFCDVFDNQHDFYAGDPTKDTGTHGTLEFKRVNRLAIYNCTFWNNGVTTEAQDYGGMTSFSNDNTAGGPQGNFEVMFFNNIFGLGVAGTTGTLERQLTLMNGGAEFTLLDYNIYFNPPNALAYDVAGVRRNFLDYQSIGGFEPNSMEVDPLISGATLVPSGASPAVNSARPIAFVVGNQTGATITLDSALPFWVGQGNYEGDLIQFSGGETARITARTSTTITLDADVTVSDGDTVSLACYDSQNIGSKQTTSNPNPVNISCPNGCPHPQFMDVNVTGSFPWQSGTQDLRWQEIGVGNGVVTADDNVAMQTAFESLLLAQWNFDSSGGCDYPDVVRNLALNLPATRTEFGEPTTAVTIADIQITSRLENPTGAFWEWTVVDIQIIADAVAYMANTPGGDALGPAITAVDLPCANRGSFPTLFANSGGIINSGTGVPFVEWDLTDVVLSQPA